MSYSVKMNEDGFDILEKESEILIELKTQEKTAKDMCRKLNLGSGFNGWTPQFIAMKWASID